MFVCRRCDCDGCVCILSPASSVLAGSVDGPCVASSSATAQMWLIVVILPAVLSPVGDLMTPLFAQVLQQLVVHGDAYSHCRASIVINFCGAHM